MINGLVKAAGTHRMLADFPVTVQKINRPTKDLLFYSFLLEYLIDILDENIIQ